MVSPRDRLLNVALAALLGVSVSVYAGAAAPGTNFLKPAGGEQFAAGSVAAVRWALPAETEERDEAELLLSLDDGMTFPIRLTAEMRPDGSGIRWHVPALATTRGRLALRIGEEGRPETERIVAVSEPFSIIAEGSARDEELFRGPAEWWTRQALADIGAEDLLTGSVHSQPERLVRADEHPEISEPSSPILPPPGPCRRETPGLEIAPGPARTSSPSLRRSAPLPLRE